MAAGDRGLRQRQGLPSDDERAYFFLEANDHLWPEERA
jgi:hypothetical protein